MVVSYGYFVQGGGPNENSRYDLTRAIVETHSLRIDPYHQNTIDQSTHDGHFYSDKAPGLAFAAVFPFAVLSALHPHRPGAMPEPTRMYLLTLAVIVPVAGLAAVALLELLVGLGVRPALALLAIVAWLIGTNAFAYGTLFMAHHFVACLSILSVYAIHRAESDDRRALWLALAGLAAAWAVLSEYPAVVSSGLIAIYALRRVGLRRAWPFFVAGGCVGLLLATYNTLSFGGPFSTGYYAYVRPYFRDAMEAGAFGFRLPSLTVSFALLFGSYRGLLPLSPFLVVAPWGWWAMLRSRATRTLGILSLSICAYYLLLNASYSFWAAGASMGPRYMVPGLPFAILAVAFALEAILRLSSRALRVAALGAVVTACLYAVALCTICVAVLPEFPGGHGTIPSPIDGSPIDLENPAMNLGVHLFVHDYVSQKAIVGRGQMTIDYSQAPEHAFDAYNLGEAIGLTGKASLLPLVALWLALMGWMAYLVKRQPTTNPLTT